MEKGGGIYLCLLNDKLNMNFQMQWIARRQKKKQNIAKMAGFFFFSSKQPYI